MISFNWPLIIVTTVFLYALTILALPFNTVTATIMLFSLIAFWSRLPGVCILEPIRLLYMMDFIDIFAVIIAIYVGPIQGATFALVWNTFPRLCGAYTSYIGCIKDGVAQAIVCLFIPIINAMVGGDLVLVMVIFSLLRLPIFFVLCLFIPHRTIPEQIMHLTFAGGAVLIINAFYAKLFGDFFTSLLMKGATFSWILFLIATVVILIFSIVVLGFSPKRTGKRIGKRIVKIARKKRRKKEAGISDNMDDMKDIRSRI